MQYFTNYFTLLFSVECDDNDNDNECEEDDDEDDCEEDDGKIIV